MLRLKQLPSFNSVRKGNKAVVDLPLGIRYHVVWLRVGNAFAQPNMLEDLVDDIVVKINDKPQRTHTALQLSALNGLNGSAYDALTAGVPGAIDFVSYLPIWFAQPWRKNQAEVPTLALRANGINSLSIEVNLRAANLVAEPNNNLFLDGWYEYDNDSRPIGPIQKFFRDDYPASGMSVDIPTLEKRDLIESMHFFATSDAKYVSEVRFLANGEELRDRITYLQNRALLLGRGLAPDVALQPRYDLVFDYDDRISSQLATSQIDKMKLRIAWNAAAAGTQTVIVQRTGPPE